MMLLWLILILVVGGLVAWMVERRGANWPRMIALATLAVDLMLGLRLWSERSSHLGVGDPRGSWIAELNQPWISRFGISLHLALDGLSLVFILLTFFLGFMAVATSWTEIKMRVGLFHLSVLWILAGVVGVFVAMDLFLFFVFWEVMLVPMYFLISIWGHEHRVYAATKFFLFTQAGSLLMLVAILALTFLHFQQTGIWTLDYGALRATAMEPRTAMWIMAGFFAAFAVKLPAVPFHVWLPDAHTEAPTGGSVILAGLLLKTGAYGLLRFAVPLSPDAAHAFAPIAMALGAIGILYGAVLAFAQTDLKRLVAYSSISHMGFVLLGIFAGTAAALQGAVMGMLAHGVTTGALFMLAGAVQERLGTRDMRRMGGLWGVVPNLAAISLFFAVASLGLPGLGNFVGEFLVLLGTYPVSVPLTALAALGVVAATIYNLAFAQRTFHGFNHENWSVPDLSFQHLTLFAMLIVVLVWLGLYPQPVLTTAAPSLANLRSTATAPAHPLVNR